MATKAQTLTTLFEDYPHTTDALQYTFDVLRGTILTNKLVKLACKRFIDDLYNSNFPYSFDAALADRAVSFIETLPHTKGKGFVGKCLIMEPWEKFIICMLFGWVDGKGNRRFQEAYISVARKNGKSALVAGIGIYMLVADSEPGAEVYCGATNQKQAMEVFVPAKMMARKRPALLDRYGLEVNASNLCIPIDGSKFEPVVGNPGDGASPHLWIIDEYHEHKTNDQVETAISGMGARTQPLLLAITTAGNDIASPCYDKHLECVKILERQVQDTSTERIFCIIYGLDKDDDWTDPKNLIKANPNMGVSVSQEYLELRLTSAIRKPSVQNSFLTKNLNKWVNAKEAWLSAAKWAGCGNFATKEDDYKHLDCVLALDLASRLDICALTRVYFDGDKNARKYYVFGDYYLPEVTAEQENTHGYKAWVKTGHLKISGETETDLDLIEERVIYYLNTLNVREVTYDPWKATHLAQRLEKRGHIPIVEFKQNAIMYAPAMDEVEAAITSGRLTHDNNPVLNWMASNVVIKPYKTDFKFPTKEKPHNKIDGMIALIMGIGRAMYDVDQSAHENGITILS